VYDEIDQRAVRLMRKRRSTWTKEEDTFLLLCRVASLLLDPTCSIFIIVPTTLIRDELHKYLPEVSMDKTARACQRRLNFMLKKSITRENIIEWIADIKPDIDALNIAKPTVPKSHCDVWSEAFLKLLHILLTKFQAYHLTVSSNLSVKDSFNFKSIEEIKNRFKIIEGDVHIAPEKPPLYQESQNVVDICVSVVINIIISTLIDLEQQSRSNLPYNDYSRALFKIYQRYPETLIRSVVTRLSKNRVMTKFRNRVKTISPKLSESPKLNPFKISQQYLFNMRSKFYLDTLIKPVEDNLIEIKDGVDRYEAALVASLTTSRNVTFDIEIPDNFVGIDTMKLDTELSTRIYNGSIGVKPFEDPKSASRYALYAFRQQLTLDGKDLKQHAQDYLVINKCSIKATSSSIGINFARLDQIIKSQEIMVPPRLSSKSNEYKSLITFIKSFKELGASKESIMLFNKKMWPERAIVKLMETREVFKVGVISFRYVHFDYISHWLVHSIAMNPKTEVEEEVCFIPLFWKNPYGKVNRKILFRYMATVLAYIMISPGISQKNLITRLDTLLPPVQVLDIIETLKAIETVKEIQLPETKLVFPFDEDNNQNVKDVNKLIYYEAASDCVIRLSKTFHYLNST